jgi:hypothetical protein
MGLRNREREPSPRQTPTRRATQQTSLDRRAPSSVSPPARSGSTDAAIWRGAAWVEGSPRSGVGTWMGAGARTGGLVRTGGFPRGGFPRIRIPPRAEGRAPILSPSQNPDRFRTVV